MADGVNAPDGKAEITGFDIEQFRAELTVVRDRYAVNNTITLGTGSSFEDDEAKLEIAAQAHAELLNMCSTALIEAPDKEAMRALINREIVNYSTPSGTSQNALFAIGSRIVFWENLAVAVAEKAAGGSGSAVEGEIATNPTAVDSEMEGFAEAVEYARETGRDFVAAREEAYPGRSTASAVELRDFIRENDYIDLPALTARAWGFKNLTGDYDATESLRVRVNGFEDRGKTLVIGLGEHEIKVDARLFYDHSRQLP